MSISWCVGGDGAGLLIGPGTCAFSTLHNVPVVLHRCDATGEEEGSASSKGIGNGRPCTHAHACGPRICRGADFDVYVNIDSPQFVTFKACSVGRQNFATMCHTFLSQIGQVSRSHSLGMPKIIS